MTINQSKYDPTRQTVGSIYLEAQKSHESNILIGDMTNEIRKSLVDDINECIQSNPFDGKQFYITVHESKDLQMKNAFRRRLIKTLFLPYPEDDTIVFFVDLPNSEVRFCWCLPHWSEMDNVLNNPSQYEKEYVYHIHCWKSVNLLPFGFYKVEEDKWLPNPNFKFKLMKKAPQNNLNEV